MDDLIRRQAAIDALIELTIQRDKWDDKEGFAQKRGIDAAICAIEDLPSAERRGRWIPVTERLPDAYGRYLVTFIPSGGTLWTKALIASYSDLMGIAKPSFHIGEVGKNSFANINEQVIAWMPLPTPYKGGDGK